MNVNQSRPKVGQIGFGKWGQRLRPVFSDFLDIGVVFSRTLKASRKEEVLADDTFVIAKSAKEMIASPNLDAIIIASPPATHYQYTKDALLAGKDVFVEKPLAMSFRDSLELVELAEKLGRVLFVGHVYVYDEIFCEIRKRIQGQRVEFFQMQWSKFGTFEGCLLDSLLVHELSLIHAFKGAPLGVDRVFGFGSRTKLDTLGLRLSFEDGTSGFVELSRISHEKRKVGTIFTSHESLSWSGNDGNFLNLSTGESLEITRPNNDSLRNEAVEFLECIRSRKTSLTSGINVLPIMRTLDMVKGQF